MFVPSSVLAALTIAGAFWVGVLAARRLRQWGDSQRSVESSEDLALNPGDPEPLESAPRANAEPRSRYGQSSSETQRTAAAHHSLRASNGGRPGDGSNSSLAAAALRVREALAHKIEVELGSGALGPEKRRLITRSGEEDLDLNRLRVRDIVVRDHEQREVDGTHSISGAVDYVVDGILHLREGTTTTRVIMVSDARRLRWLIGTADDAQWFWLEPDRAHGLSGEPPRQISRQGGQIFSLERRAQHSVALTGAHGRPDLPRVSTYVYRNVDRAVLWVERWGDQVVVAHGEAIARHDFTFLPGPG